jgi:hypothetical protein
MTAARTQLASPPAAPPSATAPGPPGETGTARSDPGSSTAASLWRRWRAPLVLVALVLIGGGIIAALQPSAPTSEYLDPAGTGANGAHALADILASRGHTVIREDTPEGAEAAAGNGGATLVITSPALLSAGQLTGLAQVHADLVLVGPDGNALGAFAPGITVLATAPVSVLQPNCSLPAAQVAGTADMGGLLMTLPYTGSQCYAAEGTSDIFGSSLVQYQADGRLITVLGTGSPLTNGGLAQQGNAALALNLLAARSRIVWLVPASGSAAGAVGGGQGGGGTGGGGGQGGGGQGGGGGGSQQSGLGLIPLAAYLVVIQLGIAVLLAALWRVRRLGPLVPERLPVVVRASETVEGLAGLYRSRRARDRAAAALRTATLTRILPVLGLAPGSRPHEVVSAISAWSGSGTPLVEAMLFGPAPADDAALVALAGDLDALERKVRGQ